MAPGWVFWLLFVFLAAAAIQDATQLRISNFICGAVAGLAIGACLLVGPEWSVWQNLLVFSVILGAGTAAFSADIVGGGDVKLLAAVGLWAPLKMAMPLLTSIFLAGGVVALAAMLLWAFRKSDTSSTKTRRIPYGLAIAFGSAVALGNTRI